jgi:IS605 OrfB family transposase
MPIVGMLLKRHFTKGVKLQKSTEKTVQSIPINESSIVPRSGKVLVSSKENQILLSNARGTEPVTIDLLEQLIGYGQKSFLEMRLVYDKIRKHYNWHAVIEDGTIPNTPPGNKILAIDLGEIHPMSIANELGEVTIITARELRALNQYRNKQLASVQQRLSKCTKGSRLYRKLKKRKMFMLMRNEHQRRDIEHKITRKVVNYAVGQKASRVVVGDVRNIANGKKMHKVSQQKISNWSHGKQVQYLTYKLVSEGIVLEHLNEAYSSKTCCNCGLLNKPTGRNYKCSVCGFVGHRDGQAACNIESKALFGEYSHIQPTKTMYLRAFERSSSGGHPAYRLSDF